MLLSQKTQAAIRQLWEAFSADGIPPHAAILQMSFLILLKLLNERVDVVCDSNGLPETVRWHSLRTLSGEECLDRLQGPVCAWLRESEHARTMPVLAQATIALTKAHVVDTVMALVDDLFAPSRSPTLHAVIYEALLSRAEDAAAWAQPAGQYFTPIHIARLLSDLVQPQPGEIIADLACGNGRLLFSAAQHAQQARRKQDGTPTFCPDGSVLAPLGAHDLAPPEGPAPPVRLFGVDRDQKVAWQAWMHLFCLGVSCPDIHVADTLSCQFHRNLVAHGPFDVVLANPPYGSAVDQEELDEGLRGLGTTKAEVLFLELILQALRHGGRAAVIVPDGLLFGRERACVAMRRKLVQEHTIQAIVSLPQGLFLPYTSVKTSLLLFSRGGHTEDLWWYVTESDGTTLDAKRLPQPERTDLPDLLVKYWLRTGDQPLSAFVNEQTWFCWDNVDPVLRSRHYTLPLVDQRYVLDDVGLPRKIAVCHGAMAVPLETPKDWQVPVSGLGEDLNLLAGRYAPLSLPIRKKKQQAMSWNDDEASPRRSRRDASRRGEDRLTTVFSLPERTDAATLQAWFDHGVQHLFKLQDEGLLARGEVRQLIELLLEVQHGQAARCSEADTQEPAFVSESASRSSCVGQPANASGSENITVQQESECCVLLPLLLE